MADFLKTLEWIDEYVLWGIPMIALILFTGLFLTIKTKALQIRKIGYAFKNTFGESYKQIVKKEKVDDGSNISPFEAFSTAVSGTIGTGNIVGVTTAIISGGPGAVFWMWVSAFFGCITKYAEIALGLYFRKIDSNGEYSGGPIYYLRHGIKNQTLSKVLSYFFAGATAIAAIGMGSVQADTIQTTWASALNNTIPTYYIAIIIAILAGLVIIGGIKRIGKVASILVPFMAVLFIITAIVLVLINANAIPEAFASIFKEAFNFKSALGGVAGFGIGKAMQYGFSRGVFSNEAGLGSSAIAHATSSTKEPVKQALWGIVEVFLVSFIICTLTALLILTSGVEFGNKGGAEVAMEAFAAPLGTLGTIAYSIILPLFAFSTILAWAVYGQKSFQYIFKKNEELSKLIFNILFILILIGMSFVTYFNKNEIGADFVWVIQDMANALMAIPNLIGLIVLSGTLITITKNYFDRKKNPSIEPIITPYKNK